MNESATAKVLIHNKCFHLWYESDFYPWCVKDLCKVVCCDMCAAISHVQIYVCTYCHQALPGFEQGLLESESNVMANYTIEPICL